MGSGVFDIKVLSERNVFLIESFVNVLRMNNDVIMNS
jgi:hypothetical protein